MPKIKYVVFDVGGVLVELTGASKLIEWTGSKFKTESELYEAWICSAAVQQFERGHCSSNEFSASIVEEFQLPVSEKDFIDEFNSWPNGLYSESKSLLEKVKALLPIACLSNTNELHWPNQRDAEYLNSIFDRMFLSYQVGMVKPDPEIFHHMIEELNLPPQHILFLDDNQINVDAGSQAGLSSHLARGIDEARCILEKTNCI